MYAERNSTEYLLLFEFYLGLIGWNKYTGSVRGRPSRTSSLSFKNAEWYCSKMPDHEPAVEVLRQNTSCQPRASMRASGFSTNNVLAGLERGFGELVMQRGGCCEWQWQQSKRSVSTSSKAATLPPVLSAQCCAVD